MCRGVITSNVHCNIFQHKSDESQVQIPQGSSVYSCNFRLSCIPELIKTNNNVATPSYLHYDVITSSFIVVQGLRIDDGEPHFCFPVTRSWNHIKRFVAIICAVAFHSDVELSVIQLQSLIPSVRFFSKYQTRKMKMPQKFAPLL